jgi:hypothetical protein
VRSDFVTPRALSVTQRARGVNPASLTSGKLSELMAPSSVENCLRSAGSMYAEVHPISGMYRWFWYTSSSTTSALTCTVAHVRERKCKETVKRDVCARADGKQLCCRF